MSAEDNKKLLYLLALCKKERPDVPVSAVLPLLKRKYLPHLDNKPWLGKGFKHTAAARQWEELQPVLPSIQDFEKRWQTVNHG